MARPRNFDHDQVIDSAVDLFWEKGYGGVAIADLVTELRISRSSLYATFGDKDGLFRAVISRYRREVLEDLAAEMAASRGVAGIGAFLDGLSSALDGRMGRVGCLIQRTLLDASPMAADVRQCCTDVLQELEGRLRSALLAAQEHGDVASHLEVVALAQYLLSTIQGMVLTTSVLGDPGRARHTVAMIREVMRGWGSASSAR